MGREAECETGFHGGEGGVRGAVGEFVRIGVAVVELLKTVAVADEAIAQIGDGVRGGGLLGEFEGRERESRPRCGGIAELRDERSAVALDGDGEMKSGTRVVWVQRANFSQFSFSPT